MKKGQFTVFLLLGLLTIAVTSVIIYMSNSLSAAKINEQFVLSVQSEASFGTFQNLVESCMQDAMDDGIYLVSRQGGKIYETQVPGYNPAMPNGGLPAETFFKLTPGDYVERELDPNVTLPGVEKLYVPILIKRSGLKECFEFGAGTKKPPYYPEEICAILDVASGRDSKKTYFFGTPSTLPPLCSRNKGPNSWSDEFGSRCGEHPYNYGTKNVVQEQLATYVQKYLENNCFSEGDLKKMFPSLAFEIEGGKIIPATEVLVGENDLTLNASYPFRIKSGLFPVTKMYDFSQRYNYRLRKIHQLSSFMLIDERTVLNFKMEKDPQAWSIYPSDTTIQIQPHRAQETNIVEISDKESMNKGSPMQFTFAVKNRYPVLHRIYYANDYGYDKIVYAGDEVSILALAEDPDEKDIELPNFDFRFSGWKVNYDEIFQEDAKNGCYMSSLMSRWNRIKTLRAEALAAPDTATKNKKNAEADNEIYYINIKIIPFCSEKKIQQMAWSVSKGQGYVRINYTTKPAKTDVKGNLIDFGDVGVHYITISICDWEGLCDYQNVSVLVLPKTDGSVNIKQKYDDISQNRISLEDIFEIDTSSSSAGYFLVSIFNSGTSTPLISYTEKTPLAIPKIDTKIYEIREVHPLESRFDLLAKNPMNILINVKSSTPDSSKEEKISTILTQCLPHKNTIQGGGVIAPYPYNSVGVDDGSSAASVSENKYISLENPYMADHVCCYGADENLDESDKKWGTVIEADKKNCFDYREFTCLVNQYGAGEDEEPNYPSKEHYFADNPDGYSLGSSYAGNSFEKGYSTKDSFLSYYEKIKNAGNNEKTLWPASKSGARYGSGFDDIKLTFENSINEESLNDVFLREYSVACDGRRGNVCNGTKTESWQLASTPCTKTQYCKYGEDTCQDWGYREDDPMYDKVCNKNLVCVAQIGPDSKTASEGTYLVRFVADGRKMKIDGRIMEDVKPSSCEGTVVDEQKNNQVQPPAFTFNDITNKGLLDISDKKAFVGVDCNYYDGKEYKTDLDKFSYAPVESNTFMHYYLDAGAFKKENGFSFSPKIVGASSVSLFAADYSCGIDSGDAACVSKLVDADTYCESPNNCEGIGGQEDARGYWCNSLFGVDGCSGRSCWNLGYGNAQNQDEDGAIVSGQGSESKDRCCGDDPGEYPKTCVGEEACFGSVACCKNTDDCVYETNDNRAICVSAGTTKMFGQIERTCKDGSWQDIDFVGQSACIMAGYKYLSTAVGLSSEHGDGPCCGDDIDEYWSSGTNFCCDGATTAANAAYCPAAQKWFVKRLQCNEAYFSTIQPISTTSTPPLITVSVTSPICGGCNADSPVRFCRTAANPLIQGICAHQGSDLVCKTEGKPASQVGYGAKYAPVYNTKGRPLVNISASGCIQKNMACSTTTIGTSSSFLANGICDGNLVCQVCAVETIDSCSKGLDLDCDGNAGCEDTDCTGKIIC